MLVIEYRVLDDIKNSILGKLEAIGYLTTTIGQVYQWLVGKQHDVQVRMPRCNGKVLVNEKLIPPLFQLWNRSSPSSQEQRFFVESSNGGGENGGICSEIQNSWHED